MYILSFTKVNCSKVVGFSLFLKKLLIKPAWLNKHSEGTDVAGIANKCLAKSSTLLYLPLKNLKQANGESSSSPSSLPILKST